MALDESWILVAAADSGIRRCLRALLPASAQVMFAGNVDGIRDILRLNPVTAIVAEPRLLTSLNLKGRDAMRVVAVFNGSEPPPEPEALPATDARVHLSATDARQALGQALAPGTIMARPGPALGRMIGASLVMKRVFERIRQVAASDGNVLIQGETGTGKDLAARAVHECSPRRRGPFVEYDCTFGSSDLMESSLFGHCRGAFTSAHRDRRGALEAANGGTLFLDDIDALDPSRQPRLLRVLQDKIFQRLGSDRILRVDVRFIAATNRNAAEMLDSGAMRRDLYYRLNVLPIFLPPLRHRDGDVALLIDYFAARWSDHTGQPAKPLSASARRLLVTHDWPGNVRELSSAVEHLQTIGQTATIDAQALCEVLPEAFPRERIALMRRERCALECRLISWALIQAGGNCTRAAALLGIHRNTLLAKMATHGLSKTRCTPPRND